MRLLVITQVMDIEHPILGFFHRWVEELAKHVEQVSVICLEEGKHQLPSNVSVYSLGKETGKGKLQILLTFYKLIWKLRKEYDNVFVHMNQIYVILGAPFWRAQGKKVGLWYAHGAVSTSLKIAVPLTNYVFTSTKEGLRIETKKRVLVGQGIDTTNFKVVPKQTSDTLRLITVGRISRSKNLETLLNACSLLRQQGVHSLFKIVGAPITDEEKVYATKMRALTTDLDLSDCVEWVGGVFNHELPPILQQSDVFIHDGSTNSLDKALLEASLCGCIVVSSNPAYKAVTFELAPEYIYEQGDYNQLSKIILNLGSERNHTETIRKTFASQYDITHLISGIVSTY